MKSIILKGYYGYGNFGDDILMLAAYGWLTRNFPAAEIMICTDSDRPGYVQKLIGRPVAIVMNNKKVSADLTFHGGGGVYFDFSAGSASTGWLNALIRLIGPRSYRFAYRAYAAMMGRSRISARIRVGAGISIGQYTSSSRRFYGDMLDLADFKYLAVRDTASDANAKALRLSCAVRVASDLAFLSKYWVPEKLLKPTNIIVGVVLRDWTFGPSGLEIFEEVYALLQTAGIAVKFYSFDRSADTAFIDRFGKYDLAAWNPSVDSIESFLAKISQCSLVVTSRAHGAIVAACLGIPSLCLEIEPKLTHISALLNSSTLIRKPFVAGALAAGILEKLGRLAHWQALVAADVIENERIMQISLDQMKAFITADLSP